MSEVTSKDGTVVRHFTAASGRTGKKRLLGACTTQTAKEQHRSAGTAGALGARLVEAPATHGGGYAPGRDPAGRDLATRP